MVQHAPTSGSSDAGRRHRVVVIGSGFGGLFAARSLRKAPVDLTLIASTGHHLFQPLLYQVATGVLSQGEIAPATREILRRQHNATVLLAAGNTWGLGRSWARTVRGNRWPR
jgi:NADH dehydrogenase